MVKTLSTALFCGIAMLAHSYAQEVFSGDQKARPKYPKALPAAADHATQPSGASAVVVHSPKSPEVAATSAKKTSVAAVAPVKKASSSASDVRPDKKPAGQSAKQDAVSGKAPTVEIAKAAPVAAPKPELATAATNDKSHTASKQTAKSGGAAPPAKKITPTKSPTVEIAAVRPSEVLPPAEGPKHVAEHVSKKTTVTQTKSMPSVPKPPAVAQQQEEEDLDAAESAIRKAPALKTVAMVPPTIRKTVVTVKSSNTIVPAPASSTSRQENLADTSAMAPVANGHFDMAFTKLADGFDFPVGKPDAQGYYKARGFRSHGHLGEDWDGVGGGDTDLGDPIYSIGDGLVVFARDCRMGWGNVMIVRHSYREGGTVKTVDALYGHLDSMLVHRGQAVTRGQKIATMGTAHGLYDAHLHLEIRKNIEIGMSRAAFAQDFSNYYDPTTFIQGHRHLQAGGGSYRVAMNTFTRDARIRWDKTRTYSHAHTGGGSSESAAALKKALAAQH
jgi:murein DD-endopeptidase MepM/ murein hydrolase activator NlpD